jgi:DNA polymerase-3 subunit gamma/tau
VPESLDIVADLYAAGADPAVVMQDLLELTHFLTRAKLVPQTLDAPGLPETEKLRGRALSQKLSLAALARLWQMLLKGLGEVQSAPMPLQAAEMALIRLAYVSDLPTPGELVERLGGAAGGSQAPSGSSQGPPGAGRAPAPPAGGNGGAPVEARATAYEHSAPGGAPGGEGGPRAALARAAPLPAPLDEAMPQPGRIEVPEGFAQAVALVREAGEGILANHLMDDVHLVRFEPGRIELRVTEAAPPNLASRFAAVLEQACGSRWVITISQQEGAATLRSQQKAAEEAKREEVLRHPLVQAVIETFPDAKLVARRDRKAPPPHSAPEARGAPDNHDNDAD